LKRALDVGDGRLVDIERACALCVAGGRSDHEQHHRDSDGTPPAVFWAHAPTILPEGLVNRFALRREEHRTRFGDVKTILETDAELAVDGDGRLVAETHPRFEARRVAFQEVRPLVAIEPDAVARTMREAWHSIARTEACVSDDTTGGGVDRFARRSRLRR